MPTPIDRTGDFRGQIVWSAVKKYDSGAVAIHVVARVDGAWNYDTEEWEDWREYDMEAEGFLFVIGKNGAPNQTQVEALCKHAGWNGSYAAIAREEWKPPACQFSIEENTYKDKTSYRIAWLNAYGATVGPKGLSPDEAKALDTQFGASMRAIIGNAKRNGNPPTGKPKDPPEQAPPLTAEQAKKEADERDIPF